MKKMSFYIKTFTLLAAITLFSFSCNVLDVDPTSSIPADKAVKDKKGVERGIFGAYSAFQYLGYYGRTYGIFSDLAADNLAHPEEATATEYAQVANNNLLPENGSIASIWASCYDGINMANSILEKIPGISDMSEAEKNTATAELRFIRALNHFNLMNYFGAVPIKTQPTLGTANLDVPRNSIDQVYNQIIADLEYAQDHLPANASLKYRATKFAATALLARVYLYKKDYSKAEAMATEVISNGGYTLLDDFADIFADDGSAETIFEIDFTMLNRNRIAEYNFPKSLNGRREVKPSDDLLDAYEVGDSRFNASIAYEGTEAYAIKYPDLSIGEENVIILRLADMYLIRAEALAESNGDITAVQDDINTIRNRAGLPSTTANTHSALIRQIEKERRVEFAFEGHRWFDLVRTGRALDLIETVNSINQTLFPIPSTEINTNTNPGMTQNPGY